MSNESFLNEMDYFHDGSIFSINHKGKELHIAMCSSELKDGSRLAGILHIIEIESIKVRGEDCHYEIKKRHDFVDILTLELDNHELLFRLSLKDSPSKAGFGSDYTSYQIKAKKIEWENCPGLLALYS